MNSNSSKEIEIRNQQLVIYFYDGFLVLLGGNAYACYAALTLNKKYSFISNGITIDGPQYARLRISGNFRVLKNGEFNYSINPVIAILDDCRSQAKMARRGTEGKRNPFLSSSISSTLSTSTSKRFCRGPRVLLVGGAATGKSYTAVSLLNAATRSKEVKIGFFDLDVGQQAVGWPGCVSCLPVEEPLPLISPFSRLSSVSFFLGLLEVPQRSKERFLSMCRSCADIFGYHAEEDEALDCGGMIIKTMRWTSEFDLSLLCEIAFLFDVTHIVLVGSDLKLEEALRSATMIKTIKFLRVNSCPNFIQRVCKRSKLPQLWNTMRIKQYFEGTLEQPLRPVRLVCRTSSVKFYDATTLKLLPPSSVSVRSLCSISKLDVPPNDVQHSSSAGFIVILEMGEDYFSFLAPQSGPLYTNHILVSPVISLPVADIPPLEEI